MTGIKSRWWRARVRAGKSLRPRKPAAGSGHSSSASWLLVQLLLPTTRTARSNAMRPPAGTRRELARRRAVGDDLCNARIGMRRAPVVKENAVEWIRDPALTLLLMVTKPFWR
jgi:hypothetical protein